jgi:hypothetical protein
MPTIATPSATDERKRRRLDPHPHPDPIEHCDSPPPSPQLHHPSPSPPPRRRVRKEKLADLRADLIALKTRTLVGRHRPPLHNTSNTVHHTSSSLYASDHPRRLDKPAEAPSDSLLPSPSHSLTDDGGAAERVDRQGEADAPSGSLRYFSVRYRPTHKRAAVPKQGQRTHSNLSVALYRSQSLHHWPPTVSLT